MEKNEIKTELSSYEHQSQTTQ